MDEITLDFRQRDRFWPTYTKHKEKYPKIVIHLKDFLKIFILSSEWQRMKIMFIAKINQFIVAIVS